MSEMRKWNCDIRPLFFSREREREQQRRMKSSKKHTRREKRAQQRADMTQIPSASPPHACISRTVVSSNILHPQFHCVSALIKQKRALIQRSKAKQSKAENKSRDQIRS